MSSRLKVLVASLAVLIVVLAGAVAWSLADGGGSTKVPRAAIAAAKEERQTADHLRDLERKVRAKQRARNKEREAEARRHVDQTGITGGGETSTTTGTPTSSGRQASKPSTSSFTSLEGEISGAIGVAYAPLGSTESEALGTLRSGHAWSSFKVPISVTVMNEQTEV